MASATASLPHYTTSLVARKYLTGKFLLMIFAAGVMHIVALTVWLLFGEETPIEPDVKVIHLTLGGGQEDANVPVESSLAALPELQAMPSEKDALKLDYAPLPPVPMEPKIIPVLRPGDIPQKPTPKKEKKEAKQALPEKKPVPVKKAAAKPEPVKETPMKKEPVKQEAVSKKSPPTPPKALPKKVVIADPEPSNMAAQIPTGIKTVSNATITPVDRPPPAAFEPKRITLGSGFGALLLPSEQESIPTGGFLPLPAQAKLEAVPPPPRRVTTEEVIPSIDDIFGTPADFAEPATAGDGGGSDAPPAQGVKNTVDEMQAKYERQLSQWLQKHKTYPMEARLAGQQGKAIVRLRMDRRGNVKYSAVDRSTGHTLLDESVMAMVKKATPMPRPPAGYPGGMLLEFLVPVVFELQ